MSKRGNSGFLQGIIINLIVGGSSAIFVKWLTTTLLNPVAGILLAYITLVTSLIYFGRMGLRKIPVGFGGLGTFIGKRIAGQVYSEGWAWNWPRPFGDILQEDMRENTLDIPMTEVLANDNIPVAFDVSIQYRVIDIFKFLDVGDPINALSLAVDSVTRIIAQDIDSENIGQENQGIQDKIQNGSKTLEAQETHGIALHAKSQWGIETINVRVSNIRLPKAMEDARVNVQIMRAEKDKEKQQAESELIEAQNIGTRVSLYKELGLGPTQAFNIDQAERGKAKRIIIDGDASPLEKAGVAANAVHDDTSSLLAGVINKQPQSTEPSSTNPDFKGSRRRKKG